MRRTRTRRRLLRQVLDLALQGAPEGAPKGACKEGGDDMWPRDAALIDEQVVVERPASKSCRKLTSKEAKLRRLLALPETDE